MVERRVRCCLWEGNGRDGEKSPMGGYGWLAIALDCKSSGQGSTPQWTRQVDLRLRSFNCWYQILKKRRKKRRKDSGISKPNARENFSASLPGAQTNDFVRSKINSLVGPQEPLPETVLLRDGNLHESGMSHATTACPKLSFRAPLEGGRRLGRQRKCWVDSVKEWTFLPMPELLTRASCRKDCLPHVPPMTQSV